MLHRRSGQRWLKADAANSNIAEIICYPFDGKEHHDPKGYSWTSGKQPSP